MPLSCSSIEVIIVCNAAQTLALDPRVKHIKIDTLYQASRALSVIVAVSKTATDFKTNYHALAVKGNRKYRNKELLEKM
jgi:hypothetical protein